MPHERSVFRNMLADHVNERAQELFSDTRAMLFKCDGETTWHLSRLTLMTPCSSHALYRMRALDHALTLDLVGERLKLTSDVPFDGSLLDVSEELEPWCNVP